jgi:hypothetical protein
MKDSKTLFSSSKFSWARKWITLKFIDNLARVPKTFRQPWSRNLHLLTKTVKRENSATINIVS